MKNLELIKERYLKDDLPRRLGAIAANCARIASFSKKDGSSEIIQSLLLESQYFIEWTVPDANPELQEKLVELQGQLARWRYRLTRGENHADQLAAQFQSHASELIQISGLAA